MTPLAASGGIIVSGIGPAVLGIVLLVGGLLVYRRAEVQRAKMPGLSAAILGALLYPLSVVTIPIQKSALSWVAR